MKNRKWIVLFLLLLILTAAPAARAAGQGSLQIIDIQQPVSLHYVAGADAVLADPFTGASGVDLTKPESAVKDAKTLFDYAKANNIPGWELTPQEEEVTFAPLEEGYYLVYSLAQEGEFTPFLVSVPTVINGGDVFHIQAKPKDEPAPEPTVPEGTTPPQKPEPEIPQTGISVIPKYVLLVLGTAVTLAGIVDLIRGREQSL